MVVDQGNRGPVSTRAAFFSFLRARDLRFLVTLGLFFAGGGLPPPPRCQPSLSPSPPSSRGGAMPCGISGRGTSSSSSSSLRYNLAPIWPPGSAGGPPSSRRGISHRTAARGVLLPFLGARLRGRHFLPARRRVRRASAIAAILRRRCRRRAQRAGLPLKGEVFLMALLRGEFSPPRPWRPSSWASSPFRCVRHRRPHNFGADAAIGISARPSPLRERCFVLALLPGLVRLRRLFLLAIEASPFILHSMTLLCLARHNISIHVSWREQTGHVFSILYSTNAARAL